MKDQKKIPSGGNREGAQRYQHAYLTNSRLFSHDIVAAFKTALDRAGLFTKDKITVDGKLHRFTVQGDRPGSKNGCLPEVYFVFPSIHALTIPSVILRSFVSKALTSARAPILF